MNSKVYKWCAVPLCTNTSIATPDKVFVYVPNKKIMRDKWLTLAQRNPADVVTNSAIYFCEDHFDLPNDMENYMQYHLMGSVSQVRMKPGCIPKKFECQLNRKTRTSDNIERPYKRKKRKMMVLEEHDKRSEEISMLTEHFAEEISPGSSVECEDQAVELKEEPIEIVEEYLEGDEAASRLSTSSSTTSGNESYFEIKNEPHSIHNNYTVIQKAAAIIDVCNTNEIPTETCDLAITYLDEVLNILNNKRIK